MTAEHETNAQLVSEHHALQAYQHEIAALHHISELVLRDQPLSATLHEMVREVSVRTGFPIATIEFYDEARQLMEIAAATGMPLPVDQAAYCIPVDQTLSGLVARSGQPLIETRAQERTEYAAPSLRQLGVQTFVCVPMCVTGRVIGAIALAHPEAVTLNAHLVPMTQSLANFIAALITRKRAEATLQFALSKYQTLFDALPLGVTVSDATGQIVESNTMAEHLLGLGREEQRQRQIDGTEWRVVWPDGSPMPAGEFPSVRALKEQHSVENVELGVIMPHGATTWINVTAAPLPLHQGVVITYNDITARKQAEAALSASEERYRNLFEYMDEGYAYCQMLFEDGVPQDWIYCDVNAAFERLTGLHHAHGKRVTEILPGIRESDPELFAIYARVTLSGQHEKFELYLAALQQWFSVSVYSPATGFFISVFELITARKQAEMVLQRSEQAFRTLYESMRDAFVNVDMGGTIRQYNRSFRELIGYSDEEIALLTYKDITPTQWHALEDRILQEQILPHGYSEVYEKEYQRKDGVIIAVELRAVLTHDEHGQPTSIWAIIRDITARKQADAVLHRTLEDLSRSNADLEQFASVASHDLQEPLRAVTGMVQLLQQRYQGQLDARADEYIGLAVEAAARMQHLISDLLTFSRVQRRGKPFEPTAVEAALHGALDNLRVALAESAAVVTHDPLPTVQADPAQLTQLFQNLLGNAIKFRSEEPPQIHVSAERRPGAWCFAVRDNGIGIAPDYFERIFVIFQRLYPRRVYPGTGIGLALCKKIVERHGGQIWVDSHLGHGATFCFTIPDRS